MIRSGLVQRIASENPALSTKEVECLSAAIFAALTSQLCAGGRVELRGFGSFSTRPRPARSGRNPRTGQTVAVPAKRSAFFRPGKAMRERLHLDGTADD